MAPRISIKQLRENAPKWIYPWRDKTSYGYGMWLALLITAGVFAFAIAFVHVRMPLMATWSAPEASAMHVHEDQGVGSWLIQRAREEGPFPSRFDLADWEGGASMEYLIRRSVRQELTSYTPSLKALPQAKLKPIKLAVYGEPELPARRIKVRPVVGAANLGLMPLVTPISGITRDELPSQLPAIEGELAPAVALETWRFMLRIDASGRVLDCVSMAGGANEGLAPIQKWLKRLAFKVEPDSGVRWVALGVGFKNQVGNDASDTD